MDKYTTWAKVPAHLKTKTQLAAAGLRPAPGQKPVARKTGGKGPFDLYDEREARAKRQPSPAQLAALAKARAAADAAIHCPDCGVRFKRRGHYRKTAAGVCVGCNDRRQASKWAREFLSDPANVILDTETTGLDEMAEIVEIAIINVAGETLLDALVYPVRPIPPHVEAIHGISNEAVSQAQTWPVVGLVAQLILNTAPRVAIYNAVYDLRLIGQSSRSHGLDPEPWLSALVRKTDCAMEQYAEYAGEWSDYYKSYRWQALDGGHRALGDCRATLAVLKRMAEEI